VSPHRLCANLSAHISDEESREQTPLRVPLNKGTPERNAKAMMLRITFALFASYLLLLVISTAEAIVCSGHDELLVAMEIEREDMIIEQLARAEQCSGSPYARACRQDSVMLFAQTMLGSCTPVGCFDLGNTTPKAMVLKV